MEVGRVGNPETERMGITKKGDFTAGKTEKCMVLESWAW